MAENGKGLRHRDVSKKKYEYDDTTGDKYREDNAKKKGRSPVFAITLSRMIKERGIDQKKFAEEVGVGETTFSNYCLAISEPTASTITKISDALGVDCHYLLTGVKSESYMVANDLGLSGEAINCLHTICGERERLLAEFDHLLSGVEKGVFMELLYNLSEYREMVLFLAELKGDFKREFPDFKGLIDADTWDERAAQVFDAYRKIVQPTKDKIDAGLYRMQNAFNMLADIIEEDAIEEYKRGLMLKNRTEEQRTKEDTNAEA